MTSALYGLIAKTQYNFTAIGLYNQDMSAFETAESLYPSAIEPTDFQCSK